MATTIMNPQVSVIPATKRHLQNGDQFRRQTRLRVAAYCRVSTEEESQETSYTAQKNHYTTLIGGRPGWQLAGIYADEGKTGTTRKGRIHFNELMEDCRAGKVDYIITKSISRFARNTVDALDCVHELQRLRPPVGIYFERENIDTLNANSEMFLTFYCSMAQEESHSISENIKWSLQKNFRSGKPQINLRRMLGYDMFRDGNWIINKEEAVTICYIYGRFLEGASANRIARELNESGRKTVNGKPWRADGVFYILRNEKYVGDLIMQKTYTESFLTHKAIKNTGEVPQYFKENHHPAIISREVWNKTQELLIYKQRGRKHLVKKVETSEGELEIGVDQHGKTTQETYVRQMDHGPIKGGSSNPFSMICCAYCGKQMRRMAYNAYLKDYTDERSHEGKEIPPEESNYVDTYTFSYGVWKCPGSRGKIKPEGKGCEAAALSEISIEQSFMEMIYRIKRDRKLHRDGAELVQAFDQIYDALCRKEVNSGFAVQKLKLLELEIEELEKSYRMTLEKMNTVSYAASIQIGSATLAASGNTYSKLAEDLKKRLEEKQEEQNWLMGERGVARIMKQNFEEFLTAVEALPDENLAGMPINVNSLDVDGSIFRDFDGKSRNWYMSRYNRGKMKITPEIVAEAPDLLIFDEHIFRTYVLRMEAAGDEIRYHMSFGLTLTSTGNTRPIKAYIGYRRTKKDGTVDIITKTEQLATGRIQHHWKMKKSVG